jgi:hypothetical protein
LNVQKQLENKAKMRPTLSSSNAAKPLAGPVKSVGRVVKAAPEMYSFWRTAGAVLN